MKTCSKCGDEKPRTDFRARKGSTDGLHGWCHPCYNRYYSQASRDWRASNRERQRENDRRAYAANPEAARARVQKWRDRNRDTVNARAREAQREAYVGANRIRILERNARRRAAVHTVDPELIAHVAGLYEMPCSYCGAVENIQIDHVVSLSRGGAHEADNLVPACGRCNQSKKDKPLAEWLAVA